MARLECICGNILNNQNSPNEINLVVYTDIEWDTMMNCDSVQPWMLPLPKYDVWRCPKCKRIYVFENGNDEALLVYKIESLSPDCNI